MTKDTPPPSLNDLDAKLREAQARQSERLGRADKASSDSGLSLALRIGVELVAALIVSVGIGLLLDHWLGTRPWMLLLFFVLGSAAGILNVFRVMSGYGYSVGYKKPDQAETPPDQDTNDEA